MNSLTISILLSILISTASASQANCKTSGPCQSVDECCDGYQCLLASDDDPQPYCVSRPGLNQQQSSPNQSPLSAPSKCPGAIPPQGGPPGPSPGPLPPPGGVPLPLPPPGPSNNGQRPPPQTRRPKNGHCKKNEPCQSIDECCDNYNCRPLSAENTQTYCLWSGLQATERDRFNKDHWPPRPKDVDMEVDRRKAGLRDDHNEDYESYETSPRFKCRDWRTELKKSRSSGKMVFPLEMARWHGSGRDLTRCKGQWQECMFDWDCCPGFNCMIHKYGVKLCDYESHEDDNRVLHSHAFIQDQESGSDDLMDSVG